MARVTIEGFRCERCGHQWAPRVAGKEPKVCPACHNPYWNTPRQSKGGKRAAKHKITKTTK